MNESEPLRTLLENLGKSYARREVDVKFDEQPRITPDGETIYVWSNPAEVLDLDMSGANEFRVIRDSLNHETAHDRWSVLDGKATFSARYPENSRVAGTVLNILEDAYIDSRRLAEYPGLRQAHAFFVEAQMSADVSERPVEQALITSIHQIAMSGRVNGIRDAPETVREFAAWVRPHVREVRRADDPDRREAIAARVTDELVDRLPDTPDLDDLLDELADAVSGDEADPETVENMPDMNVPDDEDLDDLDDLDLPDAPEVTVEVADAEDESGEEPDESAEDAPSVSGDEDEAEDTDENDDGAGGEQGEGGGEGDETDGDGGAGDGDGETDESGDEGDDADTDGEGVSEGDAGETSLDDETSDELDTLDELDERGESPEWSGVDDDEDYEEPSATDERRHDRVSNEAARSSTELGERRREREARREKLDDYRDDRDASSDEVREVLRATGLAEDIRRAFGKFATEDVTETSDDGDRINLERAVEHMSGDYGVTDVYETDYTADTGGRCIGVALDTSNSMKADGSDMVREVLDRDSSNNEPGAIVDAKVALGAIHLAANELDDDLVANSFHGDDSVGLISGPGETFEWSNLDSVTQGGSTPTARGILDATELVREQGGTDEILLVVTDGIPRKGVTELDGVNATDDARLAVERARADGMGVIGIGVGTGIREGNMRRMFGEDGYVMSSSDDLVDELVSIYANELDYERPAGY
ncbi:MIDAS domain protein [Halorubrum phage Hardycor1]|nr:MIDAS domain protein [Halorubrum phage Hardycor1]